MTADDNHCRDQGSTKYRMFLNIYVTRDAIMLIKVKYNFDITREMY